MEKFSYDTDTESDQPTSDDNCKNLIRHHLDSYMSLQMLG